jgi:GNAT superfamily N-acetyltransferase
MENQTPNLPIGYSAVPPGKIATVVTCLEMLAPPVPSGAAAGETSQLAIERWHSPANADYRRLFRAVGEQWMWVSRLVMADSDLSAILQNPAVEVYVLKNEDRTLGLLELDFRTEGECELAFFGLVSDAIGKGAGRLMMTHAIRTAWSRPIRRFWVHTCHLDSQPALAFYQRSGFKPYATLVEVLEDPRLNGVLPRDAASHVPLIGD